MLAPKQQIQLVNHRDTPADIGGNGSPCHSHLREWAQAEDEAWIEYDIQAVCKYENPHGDGCITGTPEHGIDDEEQHDHCVAPYHPGSVSRHFMSDMVRYAHHPKQL